MLSGQARFSQEFRRIPASIAGSGKAFGPTSQMVACLQKVERPFAGGRRNEIFAISTNQTFNNLDHDISDLDPHIY